MKTNTEGTRAVKSGVAVTPLPVACQSSIQTKLYAFKIIINASRARNFKNGCVSFSFHFKKQIKRHKGVRISQRSKATCSLVPPFVQSSELPAPCNLTLKSRGDGILQQILLRLESAAQDEGSKTEAGSCVVCLSISHV